MHLKEDDRSDGADWIGSADAVKLTRDALGGMVQKAWEFLIRRAGSDMILTRCALMKGARTSGRGEPFEKKDALISYEFWEQFETHGRRTIQDWQSGDFERTMQDRWGDRNIVKVIAVQFSRRDLLAQLPKPSGNSASPIESDNSAIAATVGQSMPSDTEIEAKMKELIGLGMSRDVAAKVIRQLAGFEGVGNEHARRTVNGKLTLGRPKKGA